MFRVNDFLRDDDGAVTVDWVVLTAAAVGLAIAVTLTLGTGTHDHGERIGSFMTSEGIKTTY